MLPYRRLRLINSIPQRRSAGSGRLISGDYNTQILPLDGAVQTNRQQHQDAHTVTADSRRHAGKRDGRQMTIETPM